MAAEGVGVLEQVVGGPAHLVGWSDGGIVALLVALGRPELVRRTVAIGANYHRDGILPIEVPPESPGWHALAGAYAERSPDGAGHFGVVLAKGLAVIKGGPTLTTHDAGGVSERRR